MFRKDGAFTIYRIKHVRAGDKTLVYSSLDHFGYPEGFNASGECWQKTGIHGVFTMDEARKGMAWMEAKHPSVIFRLVEVFIFQKTSPVEQ